MPEPAPPPARRWARWSWKRWLAAGLLALVLLIAVANAYVLGVTRARRVDSVAAAPARPLALVLGNRVSPGGVPSRELLGRLAAAQTLYTTGRTPRIIVSGMVGPAPDYDEPAAMAAWLEQHGVPAADIVRDAGGYRTAASMADAAAMGARSMLVVSQAYHLPRAVYLAEHAGIDAIGVPAPMMGRKLFDLVHLFVRETVARAETVVEVLVRGVRGQAAPRLAR